MTRLSELSSSGPVVLVDPGVLRDMAASLNGLWDPAEEHDPDRREQLVAAARLRLYGERDRSGWFLVATGSERDALLDRDDLDWVLAFVPSVESFEDAPAGPDVEALVKLYRQSEDIEAESALTLAYAMLCDQVGLVISRTPRRFRHSRRHDLPARLELLTVVEAVDRLAIAPGEEPPTRLPEGSLLAEQTPWWIPS
ncbi:MAG: hypothetical protein MUF83_16185 [Acidimicrobiales bacterium]|jgi:hypothetical protein|nr:hypothetical protein [Acidimicrobiales bacterium]